MSWRDHDLTPFTKSRSALGGGLLADIEPGEAWAVCATCGLTVKRAPKGRGMRWLYGGEWVRRAPECRPVRASTFTMGGGGT